MNHELIRAPHRFVFLTVMFIVAIMSAAVFVASLRLLPGVEAGAVTGTPSAPDTAVGPDRAEPTGSISWATSDFPVSDQGLTYGSVALADNITEAPDLIAVMGDRGIQGFVRKADYYGPAIDSPEEAKAWEERLATSGAPILPVFDLAGKQVDTFKLELGLVNQGPRSH